MRDYSREFALLRWTASAARAAHIATLCLRPTAAIAKIAGLTRADQIAEGVLEFAGLTENALELAALLVRSQRQYSAIVARLWRTAPTIAEIYHAGSPYCWRDVYGAPVLSEDQHGATWFTSPALASEIIERVKAAGKSWRITGESEITPDEREVFPMTAQTRAIIERTRRFAGCRAVLLWGPPGGGKSAAARKILAELSRASVTLSPQAAGCDDVWECLAVLQPDGLLVDDIDTVADQGPLLDRLEGARQWVRVIVSTANVRDALRGAIRRPGRAADDAAYEYAGLDYETARLIAPTISEEACRSGLLACYLAELEARALIGECSKADLAEMLARMKAAGDR